MFFVYECLPTYMPVCVHVLCPHNPEDIRSPGTGDADASVSQHVGIKP